MLQALDAAAVRRWAAAGVDALDTHRDEIDRLNVFPVPDSDTGTNLLLTMRAACEALARQPGEDGTAGLGPSLAALARGALVGARGNSGVILSQVLRGLAEVFAEVGDQVGEQVDAASGGLLRRALRRADELATAAVADPVPGTVLSVLHAAAEAAEGCGSDDLAAVVSAASAAATAALAETPRQLAVLAEAGVVDAGGRGLVVLLEALAAVVAERAPEPPAVPVPREPRGSEALRTEREAGSEEFDYEVMYLLDGCDEERAHRLRTELGRVGDCVSVVGDGQLWTVHVHCTDIGAAIEAGVEVGRPHRITVVRFADQIAARETAGSPPMRFVRERAVLALTTGDGVAELFRAEGAVVAPVSSGVGELLAVLAGTRARQVTVLPNAPAAQTVAEAAAAQARDTGQDVVVVRTASAAQGLAALAVHDPQRRAGDDVVAMAEAAAATRRGELTIAVTEALTWAGRCQPGDVLGMVDDEVVLIDTDATSAACALVDRMLSAGGELVTALLGENVPDGLADALGEHLRRGHPEVEFSVYPGGQPTSVLSVGVE